MNFLRTTPGIIITLIVVAVAAYYIGTSEWLAKMLMPKAPQDGDACKAASGNAGTIVNGVCVEGPGGGPANPPVNETLKTASNAPDTIIVGRIGRSFQPSIQHMGEVYLFRYAFGNRGYYRKNDEARAKCWQACISRGMSDKQCFEFCSVL